MDAMTAIFAPALEKYTRNLLARVALDYNLNEDELIAKYITAGSIAIPKKTPGPKKPRVPKEDRPPCPGFTGKKKTPCKNVCLPGDTACHFHSNKPKVPKVLTPEVCEPCNDQLTPLDFQMLKQAADEVTEELSKPGATVDLNPEPEDSESEEDPVAEMSIQDRLRMIIGEEELDE